MKIKILEDVELDVWQPKKQKSVKVTCRKNVILESVEYLGDTFDFEGVRHPDFKFNFSMPDMFETEAHFVISEKLFTVVEETLA